MDKLKNIREKIDVLDNKLLGLINERAGLVLEVGKLKLKKGEEVYVSGREREILDRLMSQNKGPLPEESIEDVFDRLIAACRALQKPLDIAYLGPDATFTHQAAVRHFGPAARYAPVNSISDVFSEVEKERADYGVVPVENSTEGVVNHTLDMFMESDLVICAEREESIAHNLLSTVNDFKKIKQVYSHSQGLAQCRRWLEAHLPHATYKEAASTADAAAHAAIDPGSAAIASKIAAKIYHLKILAGRIEDSLHNTTRFLIIGKNYPSPSRRDKTSILFSVKDRVGALHDMLVPFAKYNINLTKIESRPSKRKPWEYVFFVDFGGHMSESDVQSALKELEGQCNFLKILGSYPRSD